MEPRPTTTRARPPLQPGLLKLLGGLLRGDADRSTAAPQLFPRGNPSPPSPNCRKHDKTVKVALHQPRKSQHSGQCSLSSWRHKNSPFFMEREIETKQSHDMQGPPSPVVLAQPTTSPPPAPQEGSQFSCGVQAGPGASTEQPGFPRHW